LKKLFSRKKKEEKDESNPWDKPMVKHDKEDDPSSFTHYVKEKYQSFDYGVEKRFGVLAGKKIHVRFLRQTKRIIGTVYFFLFLMLAFVSASNPAFLLLFLGAAYLMLDYLWKSRKVAWEKKKE
jgi:hypothetical protein